MSENRYSIIEQIDVGGMAEVWKGRAVSLQGFEKQVAIKRVLPHLAANEQFLEMFLDEARVSLHLNHANIVQTFDVVQAKSSYFIVMEWIDGLNLRKILELLNQSQERLSIPETVYVAAEACKGLSHAHSLNAPDGSPLNIVHRDVSPPNILISKEGETKIVDFGLAKAASQLASTDPGVVKGKFSYISPEAAHGTPVDPRTDVFSMGTVLWEMITGKKLFEGANDLETIKLVRRCEVKPLHLLDRRVDEQLSGIVMRALEKDPNLRFQSCEDMSQALVRYLFSIGTAVTNFTIALMVRRMKERAANNKLSTPSDSTNGSLEATDLDTFASLASTARLDALPLMVKNIKKGADLTAQSKSAAPQTVPVQQMPNASQNDPPHASEEREGLLDDATLAGIGLGLIGATLVIIIAYLML
jgi:eukaryotic-like serine/threonine-protein kinase